MNTEINPPKEPTDSFDIGSIYKHVPIWLTLYAVVLGTTYQGAFWARFDIEITHYLGWQDVLRISLMPLILIIVFAALALAGQAFAFDLLGVSELSRDWKVRNEVRRKRKATPILFFSILVVTITSIAFAVWNWDKHAAIILPVTLVSCIAFYLTRRSRLLGTMKWTFARDLFLAAAIGGFPMAYAFGTTQALNVSDGAFYTGIKMTEQDQSHIFREHSEDPIRFLGHIGQYDFFYRDKLTYIVKSSEIHAFAVFPVADSKRYIRIPFIDPRPRD